MATPILCSVCGNLIYTIPDAVVETPVEVVVSETAPTPVVEATSVVETTPVAETPAV